MILAAAVRFIHFALFEGTLLSLQYYRRRDAIVVFFIGSLGFRYHRARPDDDPVPLALRADRPVRLARTNRSSLKRLNVAKSGVTSD